MPEHSYSSRRELDQYVFHPAVTVLVPVAAVLLQSVLPRLWGRLEILDLPLIVVIYFAVSRRSPVAGTITGTVIGLLQDGLTGRPLGINGIAKAIIGYVAASVGFAVDVDNLINRVAMNFVFCLLQSVLLYGIARFLVADPNAHLGPLYQLLKAVCNTLVAVPVFFLLDNFRHRD
ncbi:MAG TPA: rod shape-determining protein MreD [Acidobacteriaceae bacterium]|nr:rod shape-determining protein MreD [Acidobacteriaceae bacterium]